MRIKIMTFFLIFSFVLISSSDIFAKTERSIQALDQDMIQRIKPYKVLLVPGILDNFNQLASFILHPLTIFSGSRILYSFYDLKKELKKAGINYEYVALNTQKNSLDNGHFIARRVEKSIVRDKQQVIIISHSKGSVDTLHALISHPDLIDQKMLVGWLSLNGPFAGSPWADKVPSLINKFLGTTRTLTSSYLIPYLAEHDQEIFKITSSLPVVALASISPKGSQSFFSLPRDWIDEDNDGVVSASSSCLPGAECVRVDNIDHLGAVMDIYPFPSYGIEKRKLLTSKLLAKLMNRL